MKVFRSRCMNCDSCSCSILIRFRSHVPAPVLVVEYARRTELPLISTFNLLNFLAHEVRQNAGALLLILASIADSYVFQQPSVYLVTIVLHWQMGPLLHPRVQTILHSFTRNRLRLPLRRRLLYRVQVPRLFRIAITFDLNCRWGTSRETRS